MGSLASIWYMVCHTLLQVYTPKMRHEYRPIFTSSHLIAKNDGLRTIFKIHTSLYLREDDIFAIIGQTMAIMMLVWQRPIYCSG